MKILLVEDDPQLREAITDTLEIKRVGVVQSGNGREALTLLQQQTESPDLILSDINMPEMD
ncbi:MAG: response regulator, partial [Oceanobacter sp.]